MAKDIEVTCEYCSTKKSFTDYVSLRHGGWIIFGWKINSNGPYVKCEDCSIRDYTESNNIVEENQKTFKRSTKKVKEKVVKEKNIVKKKVEKNVVKKSKKRS